MTRQGYLLPRGAMPVPSTPQRIIEDAEEVDVEDSPRLPSDWSPLEYELLEYADSLPSGFAERIGRELEGQHRRVAQLRSLNSLMLHVLQSEGLLAARNGPASQAEHGRASEGAFGDGTPAACRDSDRSLSETSTRSAQGLAGASDDHDASEGGALRRLRVALSVAPAEASQRLVLASVSRQLELKVFEVRRAAEGELKDLSRRVRAAEETTGEHNWKLRKESCSEDVAGRKKLWEAETKLNRLQNRVQQLESRRRTWARKLRQREEEVRQVSASIAEMSAEVNSVRAQAKDCNIRQSNANAAGDGGIYMHPAGQCSAMAVMLHSGVALPQDGISQPFRPVPRSGADAEANRRSKSHPSQAFRRAPSESQPRARSEEAPAACPDSSWDEEDYDEEDVDSEDAESTSLSTFLEAEPGPIRASQIRRQAPMPDMRRLGEEVRRVAGPQRQAGPHAGVPSPVSLQAWFEELAQNRTPTENYMDQEDPTATASGLPHWFIPGHAGAPMDTSGVQQLTPTQTLRAIHPTARDRRQGRRSVSAPRLSRGHHVPPERRNPLPVRRANMPNNLLDFRSIRVFSPLTPLAREMQMFHRRATGAQVSARPAAEQVFTMERLREITTERLRMMQEGGASAFAVNSWAGGVPAPPQQGLGLSPEELLTVRTVWRVSRESELCSDFDCCAICLDGSDDKRELIALPCEHVFCACRNIRLTACAHGWPAIQLASCARKTCDSLWLSYGDGTEPLAKAVLKPSLEAEEFWLLQALDF
eukprot:s2908_g13.t1